MAEYKALAQNTYKFVTTNETVLQTVGDIGNPCAPMISRLKVIIDDAEITYVAPYGASITSSLNTPVFADSYNGALSGSYLDIAVGSAFMSSNVPVLKWLKCIVDNVVYYGISNARFVIPWNTWADEKSGIVPRIPKRMFPACTVKVVKYDAETVSIQCVEYPLTAASFAEKVSMRPLNNYGFNSSNIYFMIPKASSDIILALEFEYPKYDITFNNVGLQYSIDDGVTFADVTAGLVLEQVEHIVFKNTSSSTRYVGTTEGGSDVASIAAGATFAAVPTADQTWYISQEETTE